MTSLTEYDQKYHEKMDSAIEHLAFEMFGVSGERRDDPEIIEAAAKSIKMLKEILVDFGMPKALIDACVKSV